MTIIAIQFTAELVKVIDFRAADDFENQARFIFDKLICENCEWNSDDYIYISPSQLFNVPYKEEEIKVHGFAKMRRDLGNNYTALTAELSRAGEYATIMHFNIQGMMPKECSIVGKFVATAEEDNQKINDIEFASGLSYLDEGSGGVAVLNQKAGFIIVDI